MGRGRRQEDDGHRRLPAPRASGRDPPDFQHPQRRYFFCRAAPGKAGIRGAIKKEIPYFEIRHIIKPGLTGWAQINYRYGASVEDAEQKLQYDIYYLKNRSPLLDAAIVLRTIKMLFVSLK